MRRKQQCESKLDKLNIKQEVWKKKLQVKKIVFGKIVEEQTKINDSMLMEKIVKMMRQKENQMRDTVFSLKECEQNGRENTIKQAADRRLKKFKDWAVILVKFA